jgi:hypothetical protein
MEAATRLVGELGQDDGRDVVTKEHIVNEIAMQLSNVIIKETPQYTYRTFAYQWKVWSEDPAKRTVRFFFQRNIRLRHCLWQGFVLNRLVLSTFLNAHLAKLKVRTILRQKNRLEH